MSKLRISGKRQKPWTIVAVPGGGKIKVCASGNEFDRAREALMAELKASKGFAETSRTELDSLRAELDSLGNAQLRPRPTSVERAKALIASHDSPFAESDFATLCTLSEAALAGLTMRFSCVSIAEELAINVKAAVGTTFGGYEGEFLEDKESGQPIPDRDASGHLDVEACAAVLGIDEVWDVYIEMKNRLTAARGERWSAAAKNSPAPSAGTPAGAPTSAPN
jgi:hypothetical protein